MYDRLRTQIRSPVWKKGCGESVTQRLCSWTSVRCCEPPMKSKRRSHCMHSARAGREKRGSAGHVRRDTPIGQIVFIGNFRRRLARELLVFILTSIFTRTGGFTMIHPTCENQTSTLPAKRKRNTTTASLNQSDHCQERPRLKCLHGRRHLLSAGQGAGAVPNWEASQSGP